MSDFDPKKTFLGNTTKSSPPTSSSCTLSPLVFLDSEQNYEVQKMVENGKKGINSTSKKVQEKIENQIRSSRKERYHLHDIARKIFITEGIRKGLKYPSDVHRTAQCYSLVDTSVVLNCDVERGKAHYSGLKVCKSVWSCPICAPVIQAHRCLEVAQAMEWAYENGYKCLLMTFTFSHTRGQSLKDLLNRQARAFKKLRRGKSWDEIKEIMGYVGLIRGLEVTRGINGWHPHTHEIWIVNKNVDVEWLRDVVMERWLKICKKEGLVGSRESDFRKHAVDVIDNADTSSYIAKINGVKGAKWGIDREVTKTSTKKGRSGSRSLFEILAGAEKSKLDWKLYLEYSFALKGKRQLYFSRGLKEKVGLKDVSDEELLVDEVTENTVVFAFINSFVWRDIILKNGLRAEVLELAEKGFSYLKSFFARYNCFLDFMYGCEIPTVMRET